MICFSCRELDRKKASRLICRSNSVAIPFSAESTVGAADRRTSTEPFVRTFSCNSLSRSEIVCRMSLSSSGVPGLLAHSAYRRSMAAIACSRRMINFLGSDSRRANAQTSRQAKFARCIVPSQTRQSGADKLSNTDRDFYAGCGEMLPLSFALANTFIEGMACH